MFFLLLISIVVLASWLKLFLFIYSERIKKYSFDELIDIEGIDQFVLDDKGWAKLKESVHSTKGCSRRKFREVMIRVDSFSSDTDDECPD